MVISEQVLGYQRQPETGVAGQTRERVAAFMEATGRFELTRAEVLMLVNLQPRTTVEIHLIVEECEERLTAEQTNELLALCAELSEPQPPAPADASAGHEWSGGAAAVAAAGR